MNIGAERGERRGGENWGRTGAGDFDREVRAAGALRVHDELGHVLHAHAVRLHAAARHRHFVRVERCPIQSNPIEANINEREREAYIVHLMYDSKKSFRFARISIVLMNL